MQRGALTGLGAFVFFSLSDIAVKLASQTVPVPGVSLLMALVAMLPIIWLAITTGGLRTILPRYPVASFIRAALMAGELLLLYDAYARLPLSEVYSLVFLSPMLITLLGALFLKEKVRLSGWAMVVFGFLGVLLVLRPGFKALDIGHAAVVLSALMYSASVVVLRRMPQNESDSALVASILLIVIVASLKSGIPALAEFSITALLVVVAGGLSLGVGHFMLVRAFRMAPIVFVAPANYIQMPIAICFDTLLFAGRPDLGVLVGSALIIASGFAAPLLARRSG